MGRSAADRRSVGRASAPVTMPAPEPSRPVTSGQTGPVQDHGPFPGPYVEPGSCGIITFGTEPAFDHQPGNLLLMVDRAMSEEQRDRVLIWRTARDVLRAEARRVSAGLRSAATVVYPANPEVAPAGCGDEDAGCEARDAGTDGDACRVTGANGSAADMLQLLGRADGGSALELGASEQRPLLAALLAADELLETMDQEGPTTVIIMPAGDPSCAWERERAVAIVDGWRSRGVTTPVVVLLDTTPELGPDLRDLAAAGGGRRCRLFGGEGTASVVVDDEDHHHREADDGDQAIAPAGDVLLDALPVQVEQAVEAEQIGEGEDDAHPQRHLALQALRPVVRNVKGRDADHPEDEGEDES